MRPPEELIEFLKSAKALVLATHINPEGDALGSTIALSLALEEMGKRTALFNRDGVPYFYKFLPGWERFSNSDFNVLIEDFQSQNNRIDGVILLDCNSPERASIELPEDIPLVIIDHHGKSPGDSGRPSTFEWIEPEAPATGVMVYHIINSLGVKIDYRIALNLYTAIAIDTGTFRYPNTTPESLIIAAELIKTGVKPEMVSQALYNNWTVNRFKLLIECLKSLEIKNGIAISVVTEEDFKKTQTSQEDTENFSNFPMVLKDVELSIFLRQIGPEKWKASLRSKADIDVAKIARRFKGGGHKNAAGFVIDGTLEEIKKNIEATINEERRK